MTGWRRWWSRRPRPETLLLVIALLGTIGAKFVTAREITSWPAEGGTAPGDFLPSMLNAVAADVLFFAAVAALFAVLYAARPGRLVARVTMLLAALIGVWSVANAGWLVATGAQLQPSVITIATQDLGVTAELLGDLLVKTAHRTVLVGLFILVCLGWFLWRLVRPMNASAARGRHLARASVFLAVFAVAGVVRLVQPGGSPDTPWKDAMGFSSHWLSLAQTVGRIGDAEPVSTRVIPRAGERTLTPPVSEARPNIVIVFLESVSHPVTDLADPTIATTPNLARFATEGVEFTRTHVQIPETTKAWWTSLTSTRPDFLAGAVESVLVDEPYESLATILARRGYRSGFFEMSRGPWFGAPGFWANLGYDWAWFRENLEDPSAYLGWVNGDDFRMIEPMFEWVDGGDEPFLLTTITSVTHEPYELPEWYEHTEKDTPYERYLDTIRFSDEFLAAVWDEIEKRGLADNTLLCVIGDHGELFRPDSRRGRWVVYEELIRVPWVLRWPGHLPAGVKIDAPCSQLDLTPTILSILGWDVSEAGFEGLDALQPIPEDRRLFFSSWLGRSPKGYREGDRKYLYFPTTKTLLMFDLAADPTEESSVAVTGPEKADIVARIEEWESGSHLAFPAKRFRERFLFDHWRTFSTGRVTNAYYVPSTDE